MNDRNMSKAGIPTIIAAAVLLAVPNGFAADQPSKGGSLELKAKSATQKNVDVKSLDEQVSHLEVVDSKGNAYLLIPLKTAEGNSPVVAADGKIIVEYVHPYVAPMNR